jgi:hypothetical protein
MNVRLRLKATPSETDLYSVTRLIIRDGQVWFETREAPLYMVEPLDAVLAIDVDTEGAWP